MIEKPSSQKEQQIARANLSLQFLKTMGDMNGELCDITTFEHSRLSGTFSGWKPDGTAVLVKGLQTPSGETMDGALLRTNDIISIEFKHNDNCPVCDHESTGAA